MIRTKCVVHVDAILPLTKHCLKPNHDNAWFHENNLIKQSEIDVKFIMAVLAIIRILQWCNIMHTHMQALRWVLFFNLENS